MARPVPAQSRARYRQRAPLMILAALALLAGLWAGLIRLGWQLPPLALQLPAQHGPLMVSGFLGTLISLERAVALSQNQNGRRLYYLSPLLAGLGGMTLFLALPTAVLFVGLAVGALNPNLRLPDIIYLLGLVIFVYVIGLTSGPSFLPLFGARGCKIICSSFLFWFWRWA